MHTMRRADRQPAAWDRETLRAPHSQHDKAERVEAMFDAIAPTYERVNAVASLGRDAVWRKRTVAAADLHAGEVVLDVCCGTGDMMRAFAGHVPAPGMVIGVDFAERMLACGRFVGGAMPMHVIRADALELPLARASVDVISCAFGVRNFRDLQQGLGEMYRVARPGGRVLILEFASPEQRALRWAYAWYCEHVLPWVAGVISGDQSGAYRYLPRSIQTFETTTSMRLRLEDAGFVEVALRRMNFGGVVLYRGVKPGERTEAGLGCDEAR